MKKNLTFKILSLVLTLTIIVLLSYVLVGLLLTPKAINYYYNPDLNTYPFMMKNLIYQGGYFFDWHMGSAIYLFPDLTFLYITSHLFSNPFTNLVCNAIFQMFFFSIILISTFYTATKTRTGFRLGLISLIIFFITLFILQGKYVISNPYGSLAYLSAIFGFGFHFGAALMVFTAFFLFLWLLSNPKFYLKFFFVFLLILAGLSDPLFYIYLTLPLSGTVLIGYFFNTLHKKHCRFLLSALICCFLISYSIYHLLPFQDQKINIHLSFQLSYAYGFLKLMIVFVQENIFWGILWLLFFIFAPFSLYRSFSKKDSRYQLIDYAILFQWLTILLAAPVIMLSIGQILPGGYDSISPHSILTAPIKTYNELELLPYRYFINYLIGPTCFGFPLLFYKHTKEFIWLNRDWFYALILIIGIGFILLYKPHHLYANKHFYFQPKLTACFNKIAQENHLSNGIANSYYAETLINAYNIHNSHVALVNNYLHPLGWQTTKQMYTYKAYNFAVSENKSIEKTLTKRFGKPSMVLTCPDDIFQKEYIFAYKNNHMDNVFKY